MKMNIALDGIDGDDGPAASGPGNVLSELLLIKRFIASDTCDAILRALNAATIEEELGVIGAPLRVWDPVIQTSELHPDVLLALMIAERPGFALLLAQFEPSVRDRARAIRSLSDVDAELSVRFVDGFNRLIDDPLLHRRAVALTAASSPRLDREIAELERRGLLRRDGPSLSLARPPRDDEHAMLRWLNVTILEDVLFPGGVTKRNRLLPAGVDPAAFARALRAPIAVGAARLPALVEVMRDTALGDALATDSGLVLEAALWRMISEPGACAALVRGYAGPVRAALGDPARPAIDAGLASWLAIVDARGESAERDPALARLLLGTLFAELGAPLDSGRIQKSYRNCQTVDWSAVAGVIRDQLIRFVRRHVEPYYRTTVQEIAEIEILKYKQGGFQLVHADSEAPVFEDGAMGWRRTADRDLSILVYLSRATDFTGGALWFPEQSVMIAPDQGMAVAFPSDHRFSHCVREITSGTRYAVVGWLRCHGLHR